MRGGDVFFFFCTNIPCLFGLLLGERRLLLGAKEEKRELQRNLQQLVDCCLMDLFGLLCLFGGSSLRRGA